MFINTDLIVRIYGDKSLLRKKKISIEIQEIR